MHEIFKLGQIQPQENTQYVNEITTATLEDVEIKSAVSEEIVFKDKRISFTPASSVVVQNYYLSFTIKTTDKPQIIKVYLANENEAPNRLTRQELKTYTVPASAVESTMTFELTFQPDFLIFNEIIFELQRSVDDYQSPASRVINISNFYLGTIVNLLANKGNIQVVKLGIQGPSGLLMNLNGEEIRIGQSGIYEMNYNIILSSLGLVIINTNPKFIIDYLYKEVQG